MENSMRKYVAALVGAAALVAAVPASAGSVENRALPSLEKAYPNESYTQYYYRRGPYYGPRYYPRGYYYRRGSGAGVAAGVAGLAAGALIAGAIASQAQAAPPPPPGTLRPEMAAYFARK